jgi:cysteine synthase
VAVMPRATSPEKIAAIEFYGGRCHFVEHAAQIYDAAGTLAAASGGHYMDQFTYAERATDWRANNNIAESIYLQMQRETHACPAWIVASAGTGGTLATIGRYVHFRRHDTRVCGVDAEFSVFFDHYVSGNARLSMTRGSRIEGIGRPRVEASFVPGVLDAMVKVPDVWSLGAMHALSLRLGRRVGGSTGTNLVAALACARDLQQRGEGGSIVTLLCDDGQRYLHSYFDDAWLREQGLACDAQRKGIDRLLETGKWPAGLRRALGLAGDLSL